MQEFKGCGFCGKMHGVRCPEVKAIEYYENGTIKRVEYTVESDYSISPATFRVGSTLTASSSVSGLRQRGE